MTDERKSPRDHYAAALREIGVLAGIFGPITVLYEVGTGGGFVTGSKVWDLLMWFLGGAVLFHLGVYLDEMYAWLERRVANQWKQ